MSNDNYNECWITTFDNPFDYFEDFLNWHSYDTEKGYYTSNYVARIAQIPEDATELETNLEIERAIDEIIYYDFLNIYKKIYKYPTKDRVNLEI